MTVRRPTKAEAARHKRRQATMTGRQPAQSPDVPDSRNLPDGRPGESVADWKQRKLGELAQQDAEAAAVKRARVEGRRLGATEARNEAWVALEQHRAEREKQKAAATLAEVMPQLPPSILAKLERMQGKS